MTTNKCFTDQQSVHSRLPTPILLPPALCLLPFPSSPLTPLPLPLKWIYSKAAKWQSKR